MKSFRVFSELLLAATIVMTLTNGQAAGADGETAAAAVETQIRQLIEQLGSNDFTRREKAQGELRNLGLAAFDWLHDAQDSEDIEIAMRSRYLLRSLPIRWAQENDTLEVKEILRGYDDKDESERRNLMDQLAKLSDRQGVAALCRLARFEASNKLSKRAAILVIHQPWVKLPEQQKSLHDTILHEIGPSRRETAKWLKTYAATALDPASMLAAWEAITAEEKKILHLTPEKTSTAIVRDLFRWQSDLLERVGRNAEAVAVMQRSIDLLDGTREQLLEAVDWLMQRKAWPVVGDIAARFPQRFDEHAILLYRLAESQAKQGQTELAEKTVAKAAGINPGDQQEHIVTAYSLQERGLFEWAEREYRLVLDAGPPGAANDLRARFLLSEMLHDMLRELDAAKVLQPAVDAMDKDQNVLYLVQRLNRDPAGIRSRMCYFYSEDHKAKGERQQQMDRLSQGVGHDPTDADVLIAMFRIPDPPAEWRARTLSAIESAASKFRDMIRQSQKEAAEAPNEEVRAIYNRQIAANCNQFAWLVGNTVGDYDESLKYSLLSNELRPETAGYLDTLGRCYFAKGDLANAVKIQSRAVELEPHTKQIRRQLDQFQKALDEANAAKPDGANANR